MAAEWPRPRVQLGAPVTKGPVSHLRKTQQSWLWAWSATPITFPGRLRGVPTLLFLKPTRIRLVQVSARELQTQGLLRLAPTSWCPTGSCARLASPGALLFHASSQPGTGRGERPGATLFHLKEHCGTLWVPQQTLLPPVRMGPDTPQSQLAGSSQGTKPQRRGNSVNGCCCL